MGFFPQDEFAYVFPGSAAIENGCFLHPLDQIHTQHLPAAKPPVLIFLFYQFRAALSIGSMQTTRLHQ